MIFITTTTIIHFLLGYSIRQWHANLFYFIKFYSTVVLLFLYPLWSLYLRIRFKTIIKIFYTMLFVTLLIGAIQVFANAFDISIIKTIIDFFSNGRYIYDDVIYEQFRVNSLYKEPSTLAAFIYSTMPFVFNITFSKYKLFATKLLNLTVKLTFLPLTIVILALTTSPIYIIVSAIELFILFFIKFKKFIFNKIFLIFSIIFISIAIPFLQYTKSLIIKDNQVMRRISTTIEAGFKLDNILLSEMSLATRISTGIIYFKIFQDNPIFGVGIYNAESCAHKMFPRLKTPVTAELVKVYMDMKYCIELNKAIFWKLLAESGIIGIVLYFWFYISCLKFLSKVRKRYYGIESCFVNSLFGSLIAILSFSTFYFEAYDKLHFWLLYGVVLMLYYRLKYYKY